MRHHRIVQLLGSVKLALVLLLALAVITAAATLVESARGTAYAQATVYDTRWFEAILTLFGVNMIVMFLLRWPFPRTQIGFMITHFSVIVILLGAGATRWFGYEGVMTIREGSSSNFLFSREDHLSLTVDGAADSEEIRLYRPGPQEERRGLEVGGRKYDVTLLEYWPHMEQRLADAPGGAPMVSLTAVVEGNAQPLVLAAGERQAVGDVQVHFLGTEPLPAAEATSARGTLRVSRGALAAEFALPAQLPAELAFDGLDLRVLELNPDFKVGREADPTAPMRNPALRVEVRTPDGRTATRQIFALHPGFVIGDSLSGAAAGIELGYDFSRALYLGLDGSGGIRAVAQFPVEVSSDGHTHAGSATAAAAPGTPVSVPAGGALLASDFGLRVEGGWASAVWGFGPSEDENSPAGTRVAVADDAGHRVEEYVFVGQEPTPITLGETEAEIAVGPIRIPVDYALHLDDFVLVTYPGSDNPASFESHVRIVDPARGVDGKPVRIYMNHPLTYRGFKHFQSSYDSDRRGTVLSVNNDPGKWPTYIGYTLMTLGFLITLTRGLLWNRHPQPARQATAPSRRAVEASAPVQGVLLLALSAGARFLLGTGLTGLLLLGGVDSARAQGHDHSAPPAPFLSDTTRDAARALIVQDYQGRMKPLDTFAREMVVKVTKKQRFEGWDPIDLYLSWMAQPRYWFSQPVLSVRNEGVKAILGVGPDVKHVSAASLFDGSGRYLLAEEVEKAHRTPDRERSKTQRKLLSFDDQVNLFLLSVQGQTFKIFPVPDHPNDAWLGADVFAELPEPHRAGFEGPFTQLTEGVAHADDGAVAAALPGLASLQRQHGHDVLPSPGKVRSELWLNAVNPFVRVMALYGLALVLMGVAYVWGLAKRNDPRYPHRHPLFATGMVVYTLAVLFHLAGYVLRWTASSHAPLSNGYESLIFISVATAFAGLYYEFRDRRGSSAGLAALLVLVVLGVAMLPTFDPAISPIVPVLNSYWLIIHVTVITASYALLGLAATMGMTMLILHLFKRPGRDRVRRAILEMSALLWRVLVAGLAMLSVGTLLGGVWANESWGRYWGWDPKETWALVTILVYATVVHFRYIPALNRPWTLAAASFVAISSVIMTYLGVNYLLSGLHSYGAGEAAGLPAWAYWTAAFMAVLVTASWLADRKYAWKATERKREEGRTGIHVPA